MNDDQPPVLDDPKHGEDMRADRPQKAKTGKREATARNFEVFAKDLIFGRTLAAAMLELDRKTVRNHSMIVRAYVGATTNAQAAYVLGWLKIPAAYE